MFKVIIIGNRDFKNASKSYVDRANGYIQAFEKLGMTAEYNNIHKFHYELANNKVEIFYRGKPFEPVDLILVHSVDSDFLLGYYEILRILKGQTKHMINTPEAILNGKNKFITGLRLEENGVPTPKTLLVNRASWKNVMDQLTFPVIVKKVSGSRGVGVMKFDSFNSLGSFLDYYFKNNGDPQGILLQEFVEEAHATDFRVVVANQKVIFTMKRQGKNSAKNFRSNVAQGGEASAYKADAKMADIAIKATNALGLFLSGVDVIKSKAGYKILEVNCTPFIDVEQLVADENLFDSIAVECQKLLQS